MVRSVPRANGDACLPASCWCVGWHGIMLGWAPRRKAGWLGLGPASSSAVVLIGAPHDEAVRNALCGWLGLVHRAWPK